MVMAVEREVETEAVEREVETEVSVATRVVLTAVMTVEMEGEAWSRSSSQRTAGSLGSRW